jgi:hypothetical protein
MKKLVLAAAIATATISNGAHAIVSSSIDFNAIQLYVGGVDLEYTCPGLYTGLALTGTGIGAGQINLRGTFCLDPSITGNPLVALAFGLTGGAVAGPPTGTIFDGGTINIYTSTDNGLTWIYAYNVDASITNIDCLDNGTTTEGLVWPGSPGTSPLPGPNIGSNAVCEIVFLGQPGYLYLTGIKTY